MAALMARFLNLACPDCGGVFKWLQHPSDEPLPNFCPMCGSNMSAEPVYVPEAPHIAKSIGKTADQVYRQTEQASLDNMVAAAELTGGDISDFAAMKVTDMPDYLRAGDTAAKFQVDKNSPVVQALERGAGGFQGQTGAEYAATVGQGIFPHRGEQTRQYVGSGHRDMARAMEARGRTQ
jgi:hypothetical protein